MLFFLQDDFKLKTVRPEMTEDQFKQFLEDSFHEYFEHGDTHEVIVSHDFFLHIIFENVATSQNW